MSFVRRLPERSRSVAFVLAAVFATGAAAVSCSDSNPSATPDVSDAAADATQQVPNDAEVPDAATPDAPAPGLDAATTAAAPRTVVCASESCATALTTTLDSEGFCALLNDKTVACWGQNGNAELGRGDDAGLSDSPTPARVVDLADAVALEHTCAIDGAGGVWCWGKGPYLRGGAVATTTERKPVKLDLPPVTHLGVAATTACAVIDGAVQCWGANTNGQIEMYGPTTNLNAALTPRVVAMPPGAPVREIYVGNASFAVRTDGTVLSWGANPPVGRISSLERDPHPADITSLTGVLGMAAAGDNACALPSGVAHCWGNPMDTRISNTLEPLPERKLPEPVFTPEPVVQIATTRSIASEPVQNIPPIPQRMCAVGVSGKVYCWGANGSGQAGDGTTSFAHQPVEVAGLPGPVARVATTPRSTCALLTSGSVHCWGDGLYGQLGRGTLGVPSLVPQEVLLP